MDAYYRNFAHLPMEERKRVNWDHPESFDTELLVSQVRALCAGRSVDKPVYDFVSHTRSARTERVNPADVLVLDGILLFVDEAMRDVVRREGVRRRGRGHSTRFDGSSATCRSAGGRSTK